ncbi:MAG: RNase adapter RapZ, partial [Pseudomonadota bacterium]|nr:RNase adapter RapZ [Pseudomonadota bacterium]
MTEASPSSAPVAPAVVVTGLSGAGRTTALKILEDNGWEIVDNLPQGLLPALLTAPTSTSAAAVPVPTPLAIGLDVRARGFDAAALVALVNGRHGTRARPMRMVFL